MNIERMMELTVARLQSDEVNVRLVDADTSIDTIDVFNVYRDFFWNIEDFNDEYAFWTEFNTTEKMLNMYIDAVKEEYKDVMVYREEFDGVTNLFFVDEDDHANNR